MTGAVSRYIKAFDADTVMKQLVLVESVVDQAPVDHEVNPGPLASLWSCRRV